MDLRTLSLGIAGVGLLGLAAYGMVGAEHPSPPPTPLPEDTAPPRFPIVVRGPTSAPRVVTGATNHQGQPVTLACSTCHATRPPNYDNRSTADLDLFHQGLQFSHGNGEQGHQQHASTNSCLTCHNPSNYDTLRLANGQSVVFTEVMTLCSQCHGPQYRDWLHGAHGGMNGFWDLTKGGRMRNNCIQCHDPHTPKYQGAIPMPPPRDRFFHPETSGNTSHE